MQCMGQVIGLPFLMKFLYMSQKLFMPFKPHLLLHINASYIKWTSINSFAFNPLSI